MAEYIDKAKVINRFEEIKTNPDISLKDALYLDGVMSVIDCIPAAYVAPVKHGKWIDIFSREVYIPDEKTTIALTEQKCSECNVVFTFKGDKEYLPDYVCPNCGARMDGE